MFVPAPSSKAAATFSGAQARATHRLTILGSRIDARAFEAGMRPSPFVILLLLATAAGLFFASFSTYDFVQLIKLVQAEVGLVGSGGPVTRPPRLLPIALGQSWSHRQCCCPPCAIGTSARAHRWR